MTGDASPEQLPDEWTTSTVHVDGIDLWYYRTGEGPPIVVVHGFGDSSLRWTTLAEDLAGDYEVIAFDARGHGRSDAPETGYGIDDRIADLVGIVDELSLNEPILLGHSMGAATVAWASARCPEFPRAAILEDPIGLHEQSERDPEERAEMARQNVADSPETTVDSWVAAQYAREDYPAPHAETFSEIQCPALVLRSDVDVKERVRDLAAAESLRNGRLIHVPDAGHYVFDDAYDAAYTELQTVLRQL